MEVSFSRFSEQFNELLAECDKNLASFSDLPALNGSELDMKTSGTGNVKEAWLAEDDGNILDGLDEEVRMHKWNQSSSYSVKTSNNDSHKTQPPEFDAAYETAKSEFEFDVERAVMEKLASSEKRLMTQVRDLLDAQTLKQELNEKALLSQDAKAIDLKMTMYEERISALERALTAASEERHRFKSEVNLSLQDSHTHTQSLTDAIARVGSATDRKLAVLSSMERQLDSAEAKHVTLSDRLAALETAHKTQVFSADRKVIGLEARIREGQRHVEKRQAGVQTQFIEMKRVLEGMVNDQMEHIARQQDQLEQLVSYVNNANDNTANNQTDLTQRVEIASQMLSMCDKRLTAIEHNQSMPNSQPATSGDGEAEGKAAAINHTSENLPLSSSVSALEYSLKPLILKNQSELSALTNKLTKHVQTYNASEDKTQNALEAVQNTHQSELADVLARVVQLETKERGLQQAGVVSPTALETALKIERQEVLQLVASTVERETARLQGEMRALTVAQSSVSDIQPRPAVVPAPQPSSPTVESKAGPVEPELKPIEEPAALESPTVTPAPEPELEPEPEPVPVVEVTQQPEHVSAPASAPVAAAVSDDEDDEVHIELSLDDDDDLPPNADSSKPKMTYDMDDTLSSLNASLAQPADTSSLDISAAQPAQPAPATSVPAAEPAPDDDYDDPYDSDEFDF